MPKLTSPTYRDQVPNVKLIMERYKIEWSVNNTWMQKIWCQKRNCKAYAKVFGFGTRWEPGENNDTST